MRTTPYRFKLRRGTTAAWAAANPILLEAEPGLDTTLGIVKYGDGVTAWMDLPYSTISDEGIQDVVGAMIVAAGGTYDDEAGAIALPTGGGVELVDGTVTLDGTGSPVREFYCTSMANINGIEFPADTAVVWRRTSADVWGFIVVDPWTDLSGATTTTTTAATTTTTTTAATTTTTTTAATTTTTTTEAAFPSTLTGLYAWWDASDTSTVVPGAVMYWNDKSGNGNNLNQSSAALQPATGTRTLNSLNVLDFSGDVLGRVVSTPVSQPFTIATVLVLDATPASNQVAVSCANVWAAFARSTGVWSAYAPTYLDSAISTDTTAHVHINVFDGATSLIRLDGTQIASGSAGTNPLDDMAIGAANGSVAAPIDGAIGEIVIVQGALSGADLTGLEDYLSAKWGTP